jgi:predicted DNA binding CopG/RHH family protein
MIQGRAAQADMISQLQQAEQDQEQKQLEMQDLAHQQEMEKVALKEGAKTERDIIKMQGLQ